MKDITQICELCKKTEHVTETVEEPNPSTEINRVTLSGLGRLITPLKMDLCYTCHQTLHHEMARMIRGDRKITEFMEKEDEEEVIKE